MILLKLCRNIKWFNNTPQRHFLILNRTIINSFYCFHKPNSLDCAALHDNQRNSSIVQLSPQQHLQTGVTRHSWALLAAGSSVDVQYQLVKRILSWIWKWNEMISLLSFARYSWQRAVGEEGGGGSVGESWRWMSMNSRVCSSFLSAVIIQSWSGLGCTDTLKRA